MAKDSNMPGPRDFYLNTSFYSGGHRAQGPTGCSFTEDGQSMEEMVDQRHLLLSNDRGILLHNLLGADSSLHLGPSNTYQVLPRNHLHWLQEIQRVQLTPLPCPQLVCTYLQECWEECDVLFSFPFPSKVLPVSGHLFLVW